ncbi:hypothetical protein ACWKSP_29405 [Micromonosporaceae bacterium Da 78-11]
MGNAAWGAGHHTGVGEGLAIGEEFGRAIGEAVGLKKGIAIGVAASAVVAAAGIGLWNLDPWRLVSERLLGRDHDPSATESNPIAEKDADGEEDCEGTPAV